MPLEQDTYRSALPTLGVNVKVSELADVGVYLYHTFLPPTTFRVCAVNVLSVTWLCVCVMDSENVDVPDAAPYTCSRRAS